MNTAIIHSFQCSPQGLQVATRLRKDDITPETLLRRVYATVMPALYAVVTQAEYGFKQDWRFKAEFFFNRQDWRKLPPRVRISIGLTLSFLIKIGKVPLELHPGRAQTGTKVYRVRPPADGDWSKFDLPELSS